MDKNARRRLRRASAEKRLRYSVRKFSAGVASVAVAAFMFFGGECCLSRYASYGRFFKYLYGENDLCARFREKFENG